MFDLPDAKRIRRSDLASAPSSPTSTPRSSPDPELTALLRARLDKDLGIPIASDTAATPVPAAPNHDDDDDDASSSSELEFRLFAARTQTGSAADTASGAAPVQKIRLASPDADPDRPAGFVVPTRPLGYYFARGLDGDNARAAEYVDAAVSGAEVVARATAMQWAGCRVPWKVEVVDACGRRRGRRLEGHVEVRTRDSGAVDDGEGRVGRRRKSKRARVAVRKKVRARAEKKEEAERVAREREEAERAKRTARNREKKVKKKEREKAKKAPTAAREDEGGKKAEDVVMGED